MDLFFFVFVGCDFGVEVEGFVSVCEEVGVGDLVGVGVLVGIFFVVEDVYCLCSWLVLE